ncbi:hypothetical protein [Escherichia phage vB_EcoS_PHB17]|uniref:Uncharacterized protein n=1 Tax=Escherichia phage vB_EcoS_PHB17 TaxID=2591407 RepID=A0A514DKU0_9CAUD|nr:hypothetical protein KMB84_gp84 [Escherichia phage vB_EcoS_PHB17]QDH94287.1 hypothetical protein [Escherichia phage vB_EcoS_PHB17]
METQIDVKVISRNSELTKGIFKKGTEITIDLEDMVCYHSGLTWNVARVNEFYFCLAGDSKTVMEII